MLCTEYMSYKVGFLCPTLFLTFKTNTMKFKAFILVILLLFVSCASPKVFQNTSNERLKPISVLVEPYGMFNTKKKVDGVMYKASVGNIIWSVLLLETVVVPVVLCGWYLWEPKEMVDIDKALNNESK